jgi:catechol 2,3-dioxygenase-like lactoylglutathione lyase family enzyme
MIHGSHVIIYSKDSDADRDFFRDVLGYPYADAGHGWLIFALPPAEVAFHPSETGGSHELYLMCDDMQGFLGEMRARGVPVAAPSEQRWGVLTHVTLPSGGKLGVYQPKHASPLKARPSRRAPARKPAVKTRKPAAAKRTATSASKKKSKGKGRG